ncbi:MAG: isochorismatase family protein [Thermodesulfobacteriota bacterium]
MAAFRRRTPPVPSAGQFPCRVRPSVVRCILHPSLLQGGCRGRRSHPPGRACRGRRAERFHARRQSAGSGRRRRARPCQRLGRGGPCRASRRRSSTGSASGRPDAPRTRIAAARIGQPVAAAEAAGAMIVLSRDWHPPDHSSFRENGGVWPPHCVQCTPGADFHPDLLMPGEFLEVSKGDLPDLDQYSDFEATCLGEALKRRGVRRVFVCGLAQDVCVKATALDALRLGFETRVIASATRPLSHESGERAFDDLRRAGAVIEEGPCQNP